MRLWFIRNAFQAISQMFDIPKGSLESIIEQTDYLFNKMQEIHQYPKSMDFIDCEDEELAEVLKSICLRKSTIKGMRSQLPDVCEDISNENESIQDTSEMQRDIHFSIGCLRGMVVDLFKHIGNRINSQQCLTNEMSQPVSSLPNETSQSSFTQNQYLEYNWTQQFHYVSGKIALLISPEKPEDMETCFLTGAGCDSIYTLPMRDIFTYLTFNSISYVYRELLELHRKTSLFSSYIIEDKECNENYLQELSQESTLIKRVLEQEGRSLEEELESAIQQASDIAT